MVDEYPAGKKCGPKTVCCNLREVLEYYEHLQSFDIALEHAAKARFKNKNDEMRVHPHQWRIKASAKAQCCIKFCAAKRKIKAAKTFAELQSTIDGIARPIYGCGDLYIYDASLRIGASLKLAPEVIYLHAGVIEGAKALGFNVRGRPHLAMDEIPRDCDELRRLSPAQIEDFLCIYKHELQVRIKTK